MKDESYLLLFFLPTIHMNKICVKMSIFNIIYCLEDIKNLFSYLKVLKYLIQKFKHVIQELNKNIP